MFAVKGRVREGMMESPVPCLFLDGGDFLAGEMVLGEWPHAHRQNDSWLTGCELASAALRGQAAISQTSALSLVRMVWQRVARTGPRSSMVQESLPRPTRALVTKDMAVFWRDPALLSLSGFAFDRITVRPGTNGFELARNPTNQVWRLMKPLSTAANNPKLQFLLRGLEQARVTRFVNDDPAADLEIYGLLPPERELVFSRDTNELATLQIGRSPTNAPAEVFVRRPETSILRASRAESRVAGAAWPSSNACRRRRSDSRSV